MSSVPMPRDLSEEAVAEWLRAVYFADAGRSPSWAHFMARAVRALLREKVREAVDAKHDAASICDKGDGWIEYDKTDDEIVSRVLGEEAPRG